MAANRFKELSNSILFRIAVIGLIILLELIPFAMILSLIRERENRKKAVIEEISSKWAYDQTISGPVIDIPYKKIEKREIADEYNKIKVTSEEKIYFSHFLPEILDIKGRLYPEVRKRGIFSSVVYNSEIEINGSFLYPDVSKIGLSRDEVVLKDALLSFGLTDMRGISDNIECYFNDEKMLFNPGLKNKDLFKIGVNANIDLTKKNEKFDFKIFLRIKGSSSINFLPLGKHNAVYISSDWKSPGFKGEFLPEKRDISEKGFNAEWKIYNYNRAYPQEWAQSEWELENSSFGVELFTSVDEYKKTERSAKYAILFIALTFLISFILIEVISKKRVHPIQYGLIGLALSIFYLLLLSLSEHIGFNISYLISSISIITLITIYTSYALQKFLYTFAMGTFITILYSFLFVVLQLEDYSLLMGTIGLFVILILIMVFTRKINWYDYKA